MSQAIVLHIDNPAIPSDVAQSDTVLEQQDTTVSSPTKQPENYANTEHVNEDLQTGEITCLPTDVHLLDLRSYELYLV